MKTEYQSIRASISRRASRKTKNRRSCNGGRQPALMSRLGGASIRGDFQESANKKKKKKKKTRRKRRMMTTMTMEERRRGARMVARRRSRTGRVVQRRFGGLSWNRFDRGDFLGMRPTRSSGWGVGRFAGQPWRRPACPSSVASRNVQTLYLASRRPRTSAAPQPPVDSQLTPTVSSKSAKLFRLTSDSDVGSRLFAWTFVGNSSKKVEIGNLRE